MSSCLTPSPEGLEIKVKVVPGASRDRIVGLLGDALKIQVSAAPEHGKANEAVAALLAKQLGIRAKDIVLLRGTTSPLKTLAVQGVSIEAARIALGLKSA